MIAARSLFDAKCSLDVPQSEASALQDEEGLLFSRHAVVSHTQDAS